jgi:hypothetical protein
MLLRRVWLLALLLPAAARADEPRCEPTVVRGELIGVAGDGTFAHRAVRWDPRARCGDARFEIVAADGTVRGRLTTECTDGLACAAGSPWTLAAGGDPELVKLVADEPTTVELDARVRARLGAIEPPAPAKLAVALDADGGAVAANGATLLALGEIERPAGEGPWHVRALEHPRARVLFLELGARLRGPDDTPASFDDVVWVPRARLNPNQRSARAAACRREKLGMLVADCLARIADAGLLPEVIDLGVAAHAAEDPYEPPDVRETRIRRTRMAGAVLVARVGPAALAPLVAAGPPERRAQALGVLAGAIELLRRGEARGPEVDAERRPLVAATVLPLCAGAVADRDAEVRVAALSCLLTFNTPALPRHGPPRDICWGRSTECGGALVGIAPDGSFIHGATDGQIQRFVVRAPDGTPRTWLFYTSCVDIYSRVCEIDVQRRWLIMGARDPALEALLADEPTPAQLTEAMRAALGLEAPVPTGVRVTRDNGWRAGLLEVAPAETKGSIVILASPRSKLLFGAVIGDQPGDIYGWIEGPAPPVPVLAAHAQACADPRAEACRAGLFALAGAPDAATRAFALRALAELADRAGKDPALARASLEALRSGRPELAAAALEVLYRTDTVVDRAPLVAVLFGPGAGDTNARYHALEVLGRRPDLGADDVHAIAQILAEPVGPEPRDQVMLDITACELLGKRLGPGDDWAVPLLAAVPAKWPKETGLGKWCAEALARVVPTAAPSSAPARTPRDTGTRPGSSPAAPR